MKQSVLRTAGTSPANSRGHTQGRLGRGRGPEGPENSSPQAAEIGTSLKPLTSSDVAGQTATLRKEAAAWTTTAAQHRIHSADWPYTASALAQQQRARTQQSNLQTFAKTLFYSFSPAEPPFRVATRFSGFLPSSIQEQPDRLESARAPTSSPHQEQETLLQRPSITPYPNSRALNTTHIYPAAPVCSSLLLLAALRDTFAASSHDRALPLSATARLQLIGERMSHS
ncbi:hypothetical protein SNOG_11868 [Parastagonospora nodorum SN15]|uniref:Uncharacterized protein n=1 Tax=Phaeosphaeria nodorum (strain SN15 / ATCC MYA-4574 / FGSC 10173) TaxID=321614 RepID=Q0U8P6_PHANO|nr:hypothetical protein SNOG_11868 [Parastagonospora nodorum SN15]EAT80912.1 hypothetical protein SNOG_11868 [Parastagonospora nodorum SN15]